MTQPRDEWVVPGAALAAGADEWVVPGQEATDEWVVPGRQRLGSLDRSAQVADGEPGDRACEMHRVVVEPNGQPEFVKCALCTIEYSFP